MHARTSAAAHPLRVTHGINARDDDGGHDATWWSRRFVQMLESFGVGSRLERGRHYARGGQVTELEIEPGIVLAKVQGTRYTPYRVRIRAKLLADDQWERAEHAMAEQALVLAQLLAGRMPAEIERLLHSCGLTLFPASYGDLKAHCDCPDAENPCKHIAAVYYLLAERFDTDPFLIFTWRGRPQDELLDALRAHRSQVRAAGPPEVIGAARALPEPEPTSASFWQAAPELDELRVSPLAADAPAALLAALGPAPIDIGGRAVVNALSALHIRLAAAAERLALAE